MEFPIYRKYSNGKSFFKIDSASSFLELKVTGKRIDMHQFEAEIHPDRILIDDMIQMKDGHWETSNKQEFERILTDN